MLSRKFYHRLALALGRSVKELLATVDSEELMWWAAYYIHEPFGQEWMQAAKVAATVAWSVGAKGIDERTFMPVYYERVMGDDEIRAELEKLGGIFKAKDD